jgi:catechol 2,3-dioxygenase-like lactoylglutathione lyase family enzyme
MRIDHVIYATRDLDRAAARLESQLGVTAVRGGRHEGLGTHNLILPLGGGYLELLAVCDPDEAARSVLGAALQARIEQRGEGLMGWVVAVDDVEPVASRLGTSITTIARQGLTARLTGMAESLRRPFLPFFITRDSGVEDPGTAGAAGGITWIEVTGDRALLEHWLGGAELPVRIAEGPPGVHAVGIGDRELTAEARLPSGPRCRRL